MENSQSTEWDEIRAELGIPQGLGFRDMGGDGPGEVSPEEMVDDMIDEYGVDIDHMLVSELERAIEQDDRFEISFWQACRSYLARQQGKSLNVIEA